MAGGKIDSLLALRARQRKASENEVFRSLLLETSPFLRRVQFVASVADSSFHPGWAAGERGSVIGFRVGSSSDLRGPEHRSPFSF